MQQPHHILLCHVDELPSAAARGFSTRDTGTEKEIFIVNQDKTFYGYINSCPHTGAPLEWIPDQFLSLDGESIQCSMHGARFSIEEGFCTQGPCVGQELTKIKLEIHEDFVYWNPAD